MCQKNMWHSTTAALVLSGLTQACKGLARWHHKWPPAGRHNLWHGMLATRLLNQTKNMITVTAAPLSNPLIA